MEVDREPIQADDVGSNGMPKVTGLQQVRRLLPSYKSMKSKYHELRKGPPLPLPRRRPQTIYNYIQRLPNEILAEIFFICMPRLPADSMDVRESPLSICNVCSHWRELALCTPILWSRVTMRRGISYRLYKRWLARSSNYPLWLVIPRQNKPSKKSNVELIRLLLQHKHHWSCVSIDVSSSVAEAFLGLEPGSAPMVQSVELLMEHLELQGPLNNASQVVQSVLRACPHLQRFSYLSNSTSLPSQIVPWSQLTHINSTCPLSLGDFIQIMTHCHSSVTVIFKAIDGFDGISLSPQITLPNLHTLYLGISALDIQSVLEWLTLPSLQSLSIIKWNNRAAPNYDVSALNCLIQRSSCTLNNIYIMDSTLDADSVVDYLAMPFMQSIPNVGIRSDNTLNVHLLKEAMLARSVYPLPRLAIHPPFIGWTSSGYRAIWIVWLRNIRDSWI